MDFMLYSGLLAALDLLWWIDVILKVAIGLGAVIFVHELGHFLVAKACGVKCEKFMIGFDIGGYKISRKWGETEYGIGILPLGGYVKMLGQDDDPAHIAEQMKKSQLDESNANAVQVTGPNGETYFVDRRSYLAKSVPQRMAIISAGVIMNVIFAFIFATIAYGMGVPYLPCVVSETIPGSPAWEAGLGPGDEIIQIGDVVNPTFLQLKGGVTLGDTERGVQCVVRRAADGEIVPMPLKPRQEPGELATIGITVPSSLELPSFRSLSGDQRVVLEDSPADRATLIEPAASAVEKDQAKFMAKDRIVRVGDTSVNNYREFVAAAAPLADKPLRITVRRSNKSENESASGAATAEESPADETELTFEVPVQVLRQFGLVMKMGPVVGVQKGSPAAEAGLKLGDVIETVDGEPVTAGDRTPTGLPTYFRAAAKAGREVELVVLRKVGDDAEPQRETIRIKPRVPTTNPPGLPEGAPMGVPGAGLAYQIDNEVVGIVPGGPAEGQEIAPSDRIAAAEIILPPNEKGKKPEPLPVTLGDVRAWPALLEYVQFMPQGTVVEFTVEPQGDKNAKPRIVSIVPTPLDGEYAVARGFVFEPIWRTRKAESFTEAVEYGWNETVDALTMVVKFLQKLGTQVPLKMLGGPGTIAAAAGGAASQGVSSLLIFLTMLSANLAVINFLPIPLLDGGHMVFLAYEGLRGRPANERVVVALHMMGFAFIVCLMLFVIGLDIQRLL